MSQCYAPCGYAQRGSEGSAEPDESSSPRPKSQVRATGRPFSNSTKSTQTNLWTVLIRVRTGGTGLYCGGADQEYTKYVIKVDNENIFVGLEMGKVVRPRNSFICSREERSEGYEREGECCKASEDA